MRKRGLGKGAAIGSIFILLGASLFIGAFGFREALVGDVEPNPRLPMSIATMRMKDFMNQKGGNPDVSTSPIQTNQSFSAVAVKSGKFQRVNYMTDGSLSLEKEGDKFFVVFGDDFSTPNGPDLVVYLTANSKPTTRQDIQSGVLLSPLKSIVGKQVYEVPSEIDISQYNSVSIHCRAFNAPWSFAPLT